MMLHASLQGKVSINAGADENGHNARFNEDSLTSTVFGLMSYLPQPSAWTLLQKAVPGWPSYRFGSLDIVEFWPAWPPKGNNVRMTEPDAYLRFSMGDPAVIIDVIVETKRGPSAHQSAYQWQCQIEAYREFVELGTEKDADHVYYLAVSGLSKGRTILRDEFEQKRKSEETVELFMTDWTSFSNAARHMRDSAPPGPKRLLSMMLQGLAYAGFVERKLFETMPSLPDFDFANTDIVGYIKEAQT